MSEIPFLKKKNKMYGGGGPIERESDSTHDSHLLDMIADEFMEAFHKKDHAAFLEALTALVHMIQDQDEEQDAIS